MKTIEIKLYKFDELSEEAKQNAIEWWRNGEIECTPFYFDEVHNSFKKFAEVFNIRDWSIDYFEPYRNEYVIDLPDEHKEMTGIKLYNHLMYHYFDDLFKGKYYGKLLNTDIFGNKIEKSKEHPAGLRHVKRHSRVIFTNSCVFTGVCYDDDLLSPIYDFLAKPTDRIGFEQLIEDCIDSLCSSVQNEYEWRIQDEQVAEEIRINEYEFTEDGEIY